MSKIFTDIISILFMISMGVMCLIVLDIVTMTLFPNTRDYLGVGTLLLS
jgi:hypothetical protein